MTRRAIRTRREVVAVRLDSRVAATASAALSVAVAATIIAIYTGQRTLSVDAVTRILVGDYAAVGGFDVYTVLDNRLPRALCAVCAGFALGVSGTMFQRLTENPLGSPEIIGFTQGAAFGAVVSILLGVPSGLGTAGCALAGGVAAASAVYLLAWRRGVDGYRLLLVGVAVGAVLSAAGSYVVSRIDLEDAMAAYRWMTGGLTGRGWDEAALGALGLAVLTPALIALHRPLDRLAVGADLARSQGLSAVSVQPVAALVGTVAVAVAVCIAGPVGFVALASPHVARLLTRSSGPLLVSSGLVGAALLAMADVLALRLFAPNQLPTGVVTAVLGGVYVTWLLQHRMRRGLR